MAAGMFEARMRILCAIHPPEAIRRILDCLGLPSRPPPVAPASGMNDPWICRPERFRRLCAEVWVISVSFCFAWPYNQYRGEARAPKLTYYPLSEAGGEPIVIPRQAKLLPSGSETAAHSACASRSTAASPRAPATRVGLRARRRGRSATGCATPTTPSSSAPAPCASTIRSSPRAGPGGATPCASSSTGACASRCGAPGGWIRRRFSGRCSSRGLILDFVEGGGAREPRGRPDRQVRGKAPRRHTRRGRGHPRPAEGTRVRLSQRAGSHAEPP